MIDCALIITIRRCLRAAFVFGVLALFLSACAERADEPQAQPPPSPAAEPPPAAEPARAAGDAETAASAAVSERSVESDQLPYGEVGTQLVYGYFAFPADMVEPLPAVVLVHEWWGLNDTVRAIAQRLAAQGYIVIAVDLFEGRTTTDVQAART